MSTTYEIPLSPGAQRFSADLGDGDYSFRFLYRDAPEAGWSMDLDGPRGVAIHGVPLLIGADLLAQYKYTGVPGALFVVRTNSGPEIIAYEDLGTNVKLLYVVP